MKKDVGPFLFEFEILDDTCRLITGTYNTPLFIKKEIDNFQEIPNSKFLDVIRRSIILNLKSLGNNSRESLLTTGNQSRRPYLCSHLAYVELYYSNYSNN